MIYQSGHFIAHFMVWVFLIIECLMEAFNCYLLIKRLSSGTWQLCSRSLYMRLRQASLTSFYNVLLYSCCCPCKNIFRHILPVMNLTLSCYISNLLSISYMIIFSRLYIQIGANIVQGNYSRKDHLHRYCYNMSFLNNLWIL